MICNIYPVPHNDNTVLLVQQHHIRASLTSQWAVTQRSLDWSRARRDLCLLLNLSIVNGNRTLEKIDFLACS